MPTPTNKETQMHVFLFSVIIDCLAQKAGLATQKIKQASKYKNVHDNKSKRKEDKIFFLLLVRQLCNAHKLLEARISPHNSQIFFSYYFIRL